MKKIIVVILSCILLAACSSTNSKLSFSKIDVVPDKVQAMIDSKYTLQLINEGEKTTYVVYQAKGEVKGDIEAKGDTVTVNLDETKGNDDAIVQHVYKLTIDDEHNVIDAVINGESTPIDNVSAI